MRGEQKMKLKKDAVPTIFTHSKPLKRRLSSIQRENDSAKKQVLCNDRFVDTKLTLFFGSGVFIHLHHSSSLIQGCIFLYGVKITIFLINFSDIFSP